MYQNKSYGSGGYSSNSYGAKTNKRKNDGCCEGGCGTACVRYKHYQ